MSASSRALCGGRGSRFGQPTAGSTDAQNSRRRHRRQPSGRRSRAPHRSPSPTHRTTRAARASRTTRTSACRASRDTPTSYRHSTASSGPARDSSRSRPPARRARAVTCSTRPSARPEGLLAARAHPRQRAAQHRSGAAGPQPARLRQPDGEADPRPAHRRRDPDVQPGRRRGEHPPEHDPDPDRPQPRLGELRPARVRRVLEAVAQRRTRPGAGPAPHGPGAGRQRHRRPQPVPDRRAVHRPVPDDRRSSG